MYTTKANHSSTDQNDVVLGVLYLNARSVKSVNRHQNKPVQLQNILALEKFNCVAVTETWLNANVQDTEIFPGNYNVHRKDRGCVSGNELGGGVLLAVNNELHSVRRAEHEPVDEILVCEVRPEKGAKVFMVVCYRPPSGDTVEFVNNVKSTVSKVLKVSEHCILLGDFNLPGVDWLTCVHNGGGAATDLCNFLTDLAFEQVNTIPSNARGNMLDLVFTNQPELITPIDECTGSFNTDHTLLKFGIKAITRSEQRQSQSVLNFKRANFDAIRNALEQIPLKEIVDDCHDSDEAWAEWSNHVTETLEQHVPRGQLSPTVG